jgi:hypothetical protein
VPFLEPPVPMSAKCTPPFEAGQSSLLRFFANSQRQNASQDDSGEFQLEAVSGVCCQCSKEKEYYSISSAAEKSADKLGPLEHLLSLKRTQFPVFLTPKTRKNFPLCRFPTEIGRQASPPSVIYGQKERLSCVFLHKCEQKISADFLRKSAQNR